MYCNRCLFETRSNLTETVTDKNLRIMPSYSNRAMPFHIEVDRLCLHLFIQPTNDHKA